MARTKAIPFTITPSKTSSHTAHIGRKLLHGYFGMTSSSPNSITIMRRLGKETYNRKMRKK